MTFSTINPSTGEKLTDYEIMTLEEALSIAKDVNTAGASWKTTSFEERSRHFLSLAKTLREHKQEFAEMMTNEMGKVIKESLAEVEKCAWLAEVLAEKGEEWLQEELIEAGGHKHVITLDPLGTIYIIMPWNYPFWQAFKVALLPLYAGNTIILKHAKNVTGSSLLIEESFKRAGFPQDVFRSVIIDHETSDHLIDSDYVAACSLTGSVASGSNVAARSGKNIKKIVLELGGSDPLIVCDDAAIDEAAAAAVKGRMGNCGQVCIGAKRIIVYKSVADEFVKKFSEKAANLKQGDPLDPETDIGPLVDAKALAQMQEFTDDAVKKGAKVETGGKRVGENGAFFTPTVLTGTSKEMKAVSEEVFGPIAPIILVENDEEAIAVANDSEFGLNASIWSENLERAESMARQIDVGGIFINHISVSHPLLPLGGIKKSGFGRELSHLAIKEFVNIKPINIYKVEK